MPSKPPKPCRKCARLTDNKSGLCAVHEDVQAGNKKLADRARGSAHQRGYTSSWTAYSKWYRIKHPLCVACQSNGRLTPVQVVDHIVPHKGDYALFWDENNHQSLCKACHDRKTATDDGAFGNKTKHGLI